MLLWIGHFGEEVISSAQHCTSTEDAAVSNAFSSSIDFDGNNIKTSVHWLEKSFSMRVATGAYGIHSTGCSWLN